MKKRANLFELQAAYKSLNSIQDPLLLVLKTHLVVERMLSILLGVRLGVEDDEVPAKLTYGELTELALAGKAHSAVKGKVRALNNIRNHLAHDLTATLVSPNTEDFVKAFGVPYLPFDDALAPAFAKCCQRVVAELWAAVTEDMLRIRPTGLDVAKLRQKVALVKAEMAEEDMKLAALRKTFAKAKAAGRRPN